jgi:filamentous hemagglutinin family protein
MVYKSHLIGALTSISIGGSIALCPLQRAIAQNVIDVDEILGVESSRVDPIAPGDDVIRGGAMRGANLFHSFLEFNIVSEGQVYFDPPDGIENIFSRVTGGNPSDIFGTLGVNGAANLFLLNPNGITFGADANLDIEGSFFATTANAIQFNNQTSFSATEPNDSSLLSIQPSAFLFNQIAAQPAASIQVVEAELQVSESQNLFLVSGDILIDEGKLNAPDGRVELVGISEGIVGLEFGDASLNLSVPDDLNRTDIILTNGSWINVLGTGLGSIVIYSENLKISEASKLLAGIAKTPLSSVDQTGDITINTTDSLVLSGAVFRAGSWDRSAISNTTSSIAVGDSGNIDISTNSLEVTRGAEINTSVRGQGTAGNITIEASESVDLVSGEVQDSRFASSRIRSGVEGSATNSQGGNLSIMTGSLRATDGAYITVSSNGQGNAGTVTLTAQNIEFSNTLDEEDARFQDINSGAYSQVFGSNANGQAGSITVNTGSLALMNGGILVVNNESAEPGELRNAGNIEINAQTVSFSGEWFKQDDLMHSGAYSRIEEGGVGNSGTIMINANSLQIEDGALATVSVNGPGNAGTIRVTAPDISISGGEVLASGLYGRVEFSGEGQGGNIVIDTTNLAVRNGAVINTNTLNNGNAGRITISAQNVALDGRGQFSSGAQDSGIFSIVEEGGNGRGGEVNLTTHTLLVSGDADINTGISGGGEAGSISINASGSVILRTGSIDSRIERQGSASRAGRISIDAQSLDILERSGISTTGFGFATESSGNIAIETSEYILISGPGGGIFSQLDAPPTSVSNSEENIGSITIRTGRLEVRGNAEPGDEATITTRSTRGNAGELRIEAQDIVLTNSALIRTEFTGEREGRGGDINIFAENISMNNAALIRTNYSGRSTNTSGDIEVLDANRAGNVNIQAERLFLGSNASIESDTIGAGRAGDINLTVAGSILLVGGETAGTGESTRITLGVQERATGSGGNLRILANSLTLADGAIIKTNTLGDGDAGSVWVDAETVNFIGSVPTSGLPSGIFASTDNSFSAGNITIEADTFRIAEGAALSTRTLGSGQGGNITVDSRIFEAINGGQFVTTTSASGPAGNIVVNANRVTFSGVDLNYDERIARIPNPANRLVANNITETGSGSGLFANTVGNSSELSSGGQIVVDADSIRLSDNSDIRTNVNSGANNGGNITLRADSILAFDDSDILAFARDGQGGNITLDTPAFFGENYQPSPADIVPSSLDGNNRVDINATGAISGVITTPDVSFIQNSLAELPETVVDTQQLIAGSCIARTEEGSSFIVSGSGGLPERPGTTFIAPFPTGEIRPLADDSAAGEIDSPAPWQPGDPIVEPEGLFQLPDGRLVATHECVFD